VTGYIRSHIEFQLNLLIATFNVKIWQHFRIFELNKVAQQYVAVKVEIVAVRT